MRQLFLSIIGIGAALGAIVSAAVNDPIFRLPTNNDALFSGDNEKFYMYVDRTFEGEASKPWQAGSFGFVRTPIRLKSGDIIFSKLHEGIDVSPIQRDANQEPQDDVRPVAPGTVVYTSHSPGLSNYGRYVVVSHQVPEGTIYTLYAHLAEVSCEVGQRVGTGNKLGRLGYSGVGLNKTRAHLHLEICLMINSNFAEFYTGENKHGNFNGMNLSGFDPAAVLSACRNGEPLSLSSYFSKLKEHYRVAIPCIGAMDILRRHPFLYKGSRTERTRPESLEIAFTAEGLPIGIYPSARSVQQPYIVSCRSMPTLQQNCTVNRVKNSSDKAALTRSGQNYISQFLWLRDTSTLASGTAH